MQRFNTSTLETSYIENLLFSTYVPSVRCVNSETDIKIGETCIVKDSIIKRISKTKIELLNSYEFGKRYFNISSNYLSRTTYYSTGVHEKLGEYLRFYRDYYKIDLMPFYNCFSNRFIGTFSLPIDFDSNTNKLTGSSSNSSKKLFCFPVRSNTTYYIFINSMSSFTATIQPAFYSGNILLNIQSQEGGYQVFPATSVGFASQTICKYTVPEIEESQKPFEKYLYLFIEVPKEVADIVSVIEKTDYYVKNNSLLQSSLDASYAFSDRLLEYLTENVITPKDPIPDNITRIQAVISSHDFGRRWAFKKDEPRIYTKAYTKGVFDEDMRAFIYNTFMDLNLPDFNGYVDKDTEDLILRGKRDVGTK